MILIKSHLIATFVLEEATLETRTDAVSEMFFFS
jgi:hypothetical protein